MRTRVPTKSDTSSEALQGDPQNRMFLETTLQGDPQNDDTYHLKFSPFNYISLFRSLFLKYIIQNDFHIYFWPFLKALFEHTYNNTSVVNNTIDYMISV